MPSQFGIQSIGTTVPADFITGPGWEYIRLRNESPLECSVNLSGAGSVSLGPWQRSDFFVGDTDNRRSTYDGRLHITGVNQSGTVGLTSYIVCDAFGVGELQQPIDIDLTRQVSSNTSGAVATTVLNIVNPINSNVITVSPSGDSNNTFTLDNAGNVSIGDASHGGSLSVVGLATFQGGIQGPATANLVINTQPSNSSTVFQVAGVQRAFIDQNGLHVNTGGNVIGANTDLFVLTDTAGKFLNLGAENVTGVMTLRSTLIDVTQKFRAPTGFDIVLDTQTSPSRVRLNNLGITIAQALATGLTAEVGQFQPNMGSNSSFNGSVSGTATFYTPIWGSALKVFMLVLTGFRTATTHQFLFPSAIAAGMYYGGGSGGTQSFEFLNGSTVENVQTTTSFVAAGGASTNQATANSECIGQVNGLASDRIQIQTNGTNVITGFFIFIGV